MLKKYLKKQDLINIGYTEQNQDLEKILTEANERISQAVREELKTEIKHNHTPETLAQYFFALAEYGFSSSVTQAWLRTNIPAFSNIETDYRELELVNLAKYKEKKNV